MLTAAAQPQVRVSLHSGSQVQGAMHCVVMRTAALQSSPHFASVAETDSIKRYSYVYILQNDLNIDLLSKDLRNTQLEQQETSN
jgi:hypothetical protein